MRCVLCFPGRHSVFEYAGGRRPRPVRGPRRPCRPSSPSLRVVSLTPNWGYSSEHSLCASVAVPLLASELTEGNIKRPENQTKRIYFSPRPHFRRKGKPPSHTFLLFSNHLFLFIHYRSGAARPSVSPCSTHLALPRHQRPTAGFFLALFHHA